MSLYGALDNTKHFSEFGTPLDIGNGTILTAAQRKALCRAALDIPPTVSATELGYIDGATPGTAVASKTLVVDANKELNWSVSDAGVGTVSPFNFALTAAGAGASVDGAKFSAATEVALGTYANAINGKLDFGTAGRVTGLGGVICAELDLGPGTTQGSYACFEAELNVPASGSLGTRTSFISFNAWGANVAAFDTGGYLFDLNGVTKNTGKLLADTTSGATARPVQVLRVLTPDGIRYLPLYSTVAIAA